MYLRAFKFACFLLINTISNTIYGKVFVGR